MSKHVCIHGHFYQPPRENPWLEAIERQDSAHPYHDWNARITAECYSQNGASRILDAEGFIERIVNNYSRISFNFGPTLLSWMEEKAPSNYASILAADERSRERFQGHGSAIAQAYNHMILPLSSSRDKGTQISWGIRDFERRFSRPPEGMWLPETAVDLESLDMMAAAGISFTILSPYQALRVRKIGAKGWHDVHDSGIDPSMAYTQKLPSGREIAIFFYDGPVARAVAFERLLHDGASFAARLRGAFSDARSWPQLAHIATDGESYGHHHRFGDMALAKALDSFEKSEEVELTNYGSFLERHPPTQEVEIKESSSWSCVHGVERWRSDCGCNSGGNQGWNQQWRGPLREALDWLRDELAALHEARAGERFKDPWKARDEYIGVILDRSDGNVDEFLAAHGHRPPSGEEVVACLSLLEIQRHAMLMYTSCGWFFDELSGIETIQVVHYAARAVQIAKEVAGADLEGPFLERLEKAKSNIPAMGDGRRIYDKVVRPSMLDMGRVAAHYAVSSLFREYPDEAPIYCYDVRRLAGTGQESGRTKMAVGRAAIRSRITRATSVLSYAAVHLGDHNVVGGVREFADDAAYAGLVEAFAQAFSKAEIPEVIRLLDKHFEGSTFSLRSLFRDEQESILGLLLEETTADAEAAYDRIYQRYAPIMQYLGGFGMKVPRALQVAAERAVNNQLMIELDKEEMDLDRVRSLLKEARERSVSLDGPTLEYVLKSTIQRLASRFAEDHSSRDLLEALHTAADVSAAMPFQVDLWELQNAYYGAMKETLPVLRKKAVDKDTAARKWTDRFLALGAKLKMRVE